MKKLLANLPGLSGIFRFMPVLPPSVFETHNLFATRTVLAEDVLRQFHRHREIEINFLARGVYTYLLGGRRTPLPLRSLSVFWAGFPHRCEEWQPGTENLTVSLPLEIFFSWGLPRNTFVQPLLNGELLHEANPAAADGDEISMRRWLADIHRGTPGEKRLHCEALLFEVRGRLLRLAADVGSVSQRAPSEPGSVGKMLLYIAEHYNKPRLALREIARHARVNPNYAADVFKKTCGVSLMRYVSHQRVMHAQRLLATSGAKVLDIAMEAGFGSLSQFYHVFHAITGSSPREYARMCEK